MRVFIYATEGMYQGLHGIYWQAVVDVENREEADEYGREEAFSLIESYGLEEEYGEDYEDYAAECCWEVYKIRDDITLSTHELDKICARNDRDTFIDEYCEMVEWYE